MAKFILENYNKDIISYNGEPLLDFSLTNFLEKFMLKNPKIKKEKKEIKKIENDDDEFKRFIQDDENNNNNNNIININNESQNSNNNINNNNNNNLNNNTNNINNFNNISSINSDLNNNNFIDASSNMTYFLSLEKSHRKPTSSRFDAKVLSLRKNNHANSNASISSKEISSNNYRNSVRVNKYKWKLIRVFFP